MGSRMDARLAIAVVAAVFFAASAFPGIPAGGEGPSSGGPGGLSGLQRLQRALGLRADERSSGDGEPLDRLDPGLHRAPRGLVPQGTARGERVGGDYGEFSGSGPDLLW